MLSVHPSPTPLQRRLEQKGEIIEKDKGREKNRGNGDAKSVGERRRGNVPPHIYQPAMADSSDGSYRTKKGRNRVEMREEEERETEWEILKTVLKGFTCYVAVIYKRCVRGGKGRTSGDKSNVTPK